LTGSLQKKKYSSGNEYYYIILNIPADNTGKFKKKWIATGLKCNNNKREAETLLRKELAKYDDGSEYKYDSNMLFSEFVSKWLEVKQVEVRASTYESYKLYATHIIKYFQARKIKLCELKRMHIEEYITEKLTQGKKDKKSNCYTGLAARSVRSHKNIIYSVLDKAVANELIKNNPAIGIKVTNKSKKQLERKIKFMNTTETNEFIQFLENKKDTLTDLIFVTVHYGLRRSEVLGLNIKTSFDFQNHKLMINRTVVKMTTIHDSSDTKTPDSYRSYTMTPEMEKFFLRLIDRKKSLKEWFGLSYNDSEFLFTWDDGKSFSPDYIYHHFKKMIAEFGKPELTFHNLRHTTASILFEKNWQPKDIQEWLGHADFYTTMNIYTHIEKGHNEERANNLTGTFYIPDTES